MARIAIAGSGISGLVAANRLSKQGHEVVVFEAAKKIGGHVDTHRFAEVDGRTVAVDSGFIIFNDHTYPRFTALLRELGVAGQKTTMGLSVRDDQTGFEYNRHTLRSVFAQKRNALSPAFFKMLGEAARFNREALPIAAATPTNETIAGFLERGGYSKKFRDHYVWPMIAAIWSQQGSGIAQVPVYFVARFFDNHGFLRFSKLVPWQVVKGGSATYVEALRRKCGARIETGCAVVAVARGPDGVVVDTARGTERFDYLVVALHAPDALRVLRDPSPAESAILGAIRYSPNRVVIHTDESILPRREAARASWNYLVPADGGDGFVTYDLSMLHGHTGSKRYLVSLNPPKRLIAGEKVLKVVDYDHPAFDHGALLAQGRRQEIQGINRTWYVGAYWGNGFHEDGVRSAEDIEVRDLK
ncbi:MAG: FAD-dependent oxidoreductase [Deltaproteobacteria bacterium]|nr:FAD-dependent oxidoreductase [Deltaproteobacteria bacterium]